MHTPKSRKKPKAAHRQTPVKRAKVGSRQVPRLCREPLKTFHPHPSGFWTRDDGTDEFVSSNELIGVPDENGELVYVLADEKALKILERAGLLQR